MKGSGRKKKEEAKVPPEEENVAEVVEEDKEEDEDEEEEEEGEYEDDEQVEVDEGEEGKPKLQDGFYEIEDVKRKRICKGQLQYLIKWRGWPESANTWEPVENLQSCSDIILAFEQSIKSGTKTNRKRRRKSSSSSLAQTRKKKHQNRPTSSTLRLPGGASPNSEPEPEPQPDATPFPPLDDGGAVEVAKAPSTDLHVDTEVDHGNGDGDGDGDGDEHPTGNGSRDAPLPFQFKPPIETSDPHSPKFKPTSTSNSGNISIDIPDAAPSNELPNANHTTPVQANRYTGARKRKSGFVRRFKQDPSPLQVAEAPHQMTTESRGKNKAPGIRDIESTGGDAANLDNSVTPSLITKIIRVTKFETKITNDMQDVSVTFKAMRSDGSEVDVDNKYLHANNPLLLISFYEQHLRYTPPN